MTREVGERIGAVLSATAHTVKLIGYGVYSGEEVPPHDIEGFNVGIPNPKLTMDDGTIVWGCECWWGTEDSVKASIEGRVIEHVDMKAERSL